MSYYAATPATLAAIDAIAQPGDCVLLDPGDYGALAPISTGVTWFAWPASRFTSLSLSTPDHVVFGGSYANSMSISGDNCRVDGATIGTAAQYAHAFNIHKPSGVSGVEVRNCTMYLAPTSTDATAFLVRIQAEDQYRHHDLLLDHNTIWLRIPAGQNTEMKVIMLDRLVNCYFTRNVWRVNDYSSPAPQVRQTFLVRDGVEGCTWDSELIWCLNLGAGGNSGVDLLSYGNGMSGSGNKYLGCTIQNETQGYTQYQWKMQDGDVFQDNTVETKNGFRISGVQGAALVKNNHFAVYAPGTAKSLIVGGGGNWSGLLSVVANTYNKGVDYSPGVAGALYADYNAYYYEPVPNWPNGWDAHGIGNLGEP